MHTSAGRILVVLVMLASTLSAVEPAKTLRSTLSPEAFKKSGLGKLNSEELKFLDLQIFGAAPSAAPLPEESKKDLPAIPIAPVAQAPAQPSGPTGEAAFGHEEKIVEEVTKTRNIPQEIHSRILGRFEGWSGKTVFNLENGQKWIQSESGELVVSVESPEVTIKKGLFGVFYLRIAGYGSTVKVKRLK